MLALLRARDVLNYIKKGDIALSLNNVLDNLSVNIKINSLAFENINISFNDEESFVDAFLNCSVSDFSKAKYNTFKIPVKIKIDEDFKNCLKKEIAMLFS